MNLLTMKQITREQPEAAPSTAVGRPRALGEMRYDAVLVSPVRAADSLTGQLAALFWRAEYSVATIHCPEPEAPRPTVDELDHTRVCLVVVPEKIAIESQWLWWILGRASATTRRQAIIPVARRDDAKPIDAFRPSLPKPLRELAYLGRSRAVGEESDSLWVAPSEAPLNTRDAVNLEFWLYERG
jgi:hypothetical protein